MSCGLHSQLPYSLESWNVNLFPGPRITPHCRGPVDHPESPEANQTNVGTGRLDAGAAFDIKADRARRIEDPSPAPLSVVINATPVEPWNPQDIQTTKVIVN